MRMTPREIMASFDVAEARHRGETAKNLSIAALGAQGKASAIAAQLDQLQD
jgi:hypothetical protein